MEMSKKMKLAIMRIYEIMSNGEGDCPEYPLMVNDCGDFDVIIRRYDSRNVKTALFEDGNYSVSIRPMTEGGCVFGFRLNIWFGQSDRTSFENPEMTMENGKLVITEVCNGWTRKYIL